MSRNKYLFLFASYDKNGIIDDALIHYVSTLSQHSDVIVCMDNDCQTKELNKLKPFTIHKMAKRHGEYDFGSYKRCFQYARDNDLLKNYDAVFLVNDSVFGPLNDISKTLKDINRLNTDAAGMVISNHKTHTFMESWFIRLNKKIFMAPWFDEFMSNVQHESDKSVITIKYEHGLSNLIKNHGCSWSGVYSVYGRKTYNNPKLLYKNGCPFIKRACFIRHNGAAGAQIKYVLNHADPQVRNAIMTTANRIYGKKYMDWLLTNNPLKTFFRNITYVFKKIGHGEL